MEQQDFVVNKDGSVEWVGGRCPVSPGAKIRVGMRSGYTVDVSAPENLDWRHHGNAADITSYSIIEAAPDHATDLVPGAELTALPGRDYRKELWIGVAIAVAGGQAANGVSASAESWAVSALEAFDKAFPAQDGA